MRRVGVMGVAGALVGAWVAAWASPPAVVGAEPPPDEAQVSEAAAERPQIVALSETRSRLGVIEFDRVTREIVVPAEVNMVRGMLEYALVGEKGKLHESLLSTKARAFDLNVVLLLLNFRPDARWWVPPARPKPLAAALEGSLMDVRVRWREGGEAVEREARLDAWITDLTTKMPAKATPWVLTGSYVNEDGRFAAEVDGSMVALYLDPRAMINSPREGADNDEQWVPGPEVPPKGTPVTVVITPVGSGKQPK